MDRTKSHLVRAPKSSTGETLNSGSMDIVEEFEDGHTPGGVNSIHGDSVLLEGMLTKMKDMELRMATMQLQIDELHLENKTLQDQVNATQIPDGNAVELAKNHNDSTVPLMPVPVVQPPQIVIDVASSSQSLSTATSDNQLPFRDYPDNDDEYHIPSRRDEYHVEGQALINHSKDNGTIHLAQNTGTNSLDSRVQPRNTNRLIQSHSENFTCFTSNENHDQYHRQGKRSRSHEFPFRHGNTPSVTFQDEMVMHSPHGPNDIVYHQPISSMDSNHTHGTCAIHQFEMDELAHPPPKNFMFFALFVTLCCNCLCGIIALYFSCESDNEYEKGNYDEANEKARRAFCFSVSGIAMTVFGGLLILVIFAVGAFGETVL